MIEGLAVDPTVVDNARHPRIQESTHVIAAATRPSCSVLVEAIYAGSWDSKTDLGIDEVFLCFA